MWKASRYNVHLPGGNDDVLVVNTLRRGIVSLPRPLAECIRSKILPDIDLDDNSLGTLSDNGLLVPESEDETAALSEWYHGVCSSLDDVRCTIALTSACNLNCSYCFEAGALRQTPQTMSEDVIQATLQWLAGLTEYGKSQRLHLVFYGGEPTVAREQMLSCATLARSSLPSDTAVTFGMYSNGVSFSDDLRQFFAQPDFHWAQIALDGPEEVHDARRARRDGSGTFQDVYRNTAFLIHECSVHVRLVINFDRDNYELIPCLLHQIASGELAEAEVAFNPVFNTGLNSPYCAAHNFPEHDTYVRWRSLYEQATRLGLRTPYLRMLDKGPCPLHRLGHVYVSPKGDAYECIGLLGMEAHSTGTVKEPFTHASMHRRASWIAAATARDDRCRDCFYLPLCLGGCRFKALCDTGDLMGWMCHRDLIETCELPLCRLAGATGRA